MLEKILRMTHSDLPQILIDGHSSLLAKLLTQNALTARCLITKFIQRKGTFQASRQTALCLDAGHFHPTEVISDKISAAMLYVPQLLLHVSRPVRWDSDHVVLLDDETQAIASEIVRHDLFDRVHIGLDFFDASINRIAAWVIGTRNMKKALLRALLEPTAELRKLEAAGDYTARLALLEEQKSLPWQAVWEMYCQRHDTPAGSEWLESVRAYEKAILSQRG